MSAQPRKDEGLFCLITEITARKKLEEDLIRAKEEAESASRIKSQFLANMSHELRTPIAAILGYSEILSDPEFKNQMNSFMIDGIHNNSEHMIKLIDDVLDIAKIEADKITIHPIMYSPENLLVEVSQICGIRAEASGIKLTTTASGLIPSACKLDPTRLRQILINLVNNAIKFSSAGTTVSLVLTIEFKNKRRCLSFVVRDEGIGMSLKEQQSLFKPFSQVDSSMTREYDGAGLGLALSARLAEAMSGSISVVSFKGKGSIFTVSIPILRGSYIEELHQNPPLEDRTPEASLIKREHILVVEDNEGLCQIIRIGLQRVGLKVEVCGDGKTAIELAKIHNFDLILMDIQLPIMDGNEAIRILRRQGFTNPILALSAHAKTSDRNTTLKAGANEYLVKPLRRESLIKAVKTQLAGKTNSGKTQHAPPSERHSELGEF